VGFTSLKFELGTVPPVTVTLPEVTNTAFFSTPT
jgi:hypothetical protein